MENLIHLKGYDGNGNMAMGYKTYFLAEDNNNRDSRFWYVDPSVVNHINAIQQENASLKQLAEMQKEEIATLKEDNAFLQDQKKRRNMQIKDLEKRLDEKQKENNYQENTIFDNFLFFAKNQTSELSKEDVIKCLVSACEAKNTDLL
jgi:predicted nuclease with TOPRIM domain